VTTSGTDPNVLYRERCAENLGDQMDLHGLSRKDLRLELADRGIAVTEQAIGTWLRAECAPRPHVQAALASILRTRVHILFPIEQVAA
jgi:hypothetical protein